MENSQITSVRRSGLLALFRCTLCSFLALSTLQLLGVTAASAATFQIVMEEPRIFPSITGGTDDFKLPTQPTTRSFCCSITAQGPAGTIKFGAVTPLGYIVVDRGKDEPSVHGSSGGEAARKCFIDDPNSATASNSFSFPVLVGGGAGTGTATNVLVRCEETTLVGGYNTSVTDFNFLEIGAAASGNGFTPTTITGVVYLRDVINAVDKEIPFSLTTAGATRLGRVDVNIHDAVGNQSFGPVIITHDGPPGAIFARLVQYKITSTNPFAFQPVLEQQFVPKGTQQ